VNLTLLAGCLQAVFTTRADELAFAARFIKRRNKVTGSSFLQALASVWSARPAASLEDLALPLGIARQSLHDRFTPEAVTFCHRALLEALGHAFCADAEALPLLAGFNGVYLDDCTQLPLPDACACDFPGCGNGDGSSGKAGMKVFTRFEVQSGRIHHLGFHPARPADAKAIGLAPDLPSGSLTLADLGFADFARMQGHSDGGVYFISKLPVQTRVRLPGGPGSRPLTELLRQWRQQGKADIDLADVRVGDKADATATGRLTALLCPPEVVEGRRRKLNEQAKRRGRQVSERQREMCRWQVLFSNVSQARLTGEQVRRVYRLRWQVELLFKRFKSQGGMRKSSSDKPDRVKCEWYVKLLIQVVKNWLMLLRGGPLAGLNQALLGELAQEWARKVFDAAGKGLRGLLAVLRQLRELLRRLRRRTTRRKGPTAHQWFAAASPPG
jgi:hypothetical protein